MGLMGILGGIGASFGLNEIKRKEASKQASVQRRFQKMMSDSAHQREMDDLRNAGLNPILSMGGSGASTPAGAMAPVPDYAAGAAGAVHAAIQHSQMKANVRQSTAVAQQSEVDAKMVEDMYRMYEGNSAVKAATLGGMLGKKAGAVPGSGALAGMGQSAVKVVNRYVDKALEGTSARHYDRLNKQSRGLRSIIINGKKIDLRRPKK